MLRFEVRRKTTRQLLVLRSLVRYLSFSLKSLMQIWQHSFFVSLIRVQSNGIISSRETAILLSKSSGRSSLVGRSIAKPLLVKNHGFRLANWNEYFSMLLLLTKALGDWANIPVNVMVLSFQAKSDSSSDNLPIFWLQS